MPTPELIFDAEMFVAAGLALALITLWLRRDLRGNMIGMSITMGVGLVGLVLLARYGTALSDATIALVTREALLLLVAIGFTRIIADVRVPGRAQAARDAADPGRRADCHHPDRVRADPDEGSPA